MKLITVVALILVIQENKTKINRALPSMIGGGLYL